MSKIKILSEDAANKIAAGEVIERPSSVVKELIENSIDAGAQRITIILQAGGKRLIMVNDNGQGMDHDDLLLAFERHATSKITSAEDLASINTLGFRGEALPSIASVSRLTIRSNTDYSQPGTDIRIVSGVIKRVSECAVNRGTSIEVRDLFFNVPARKKFLKSTETELAHIMDRIIPYALAHPEIHFSCHHNKEILAAPAVKSLKERIFQIYGRSILEGLLELQQEKDFLRLKGFISKRDYHRSSSNMQFIFVNNRMIRDRIISHAIREAYQTTIPKGRYPIIFLFLELPAEMVDVNVHPTKIEVRFQQQGIIHDIVRDSIINSLQKERTTTLFKTEEQREKIPSAKEEDYLGRIRGRAEKSLGRALWQPGMTATTGEASRTHLPAIEHQIEPAKKHEEQLRRQGAVVLGQHKNSYIVAVDEEGVLIVDQHAAHERMLYEELREKLQEDRIERQIVLMPLMLEVDPAEGILLEEYAEELEKVGFVIEPFGKNTFAVKEIPALLVDRNIELVVREIISGLKDEVRDYQKEKIFHKMITSIACHSAIKAHDPLTMEKMQYLLDELRARNIPLTCPHGRPIILRIPDKDIEKNFLRS